MKTQVIARRRAMAEQLKKSPREILEQVRRREEVLKQEQLKCQEAILEQLRKTWPLTMGDAGLQELEHLLPSHRPLKESSEEILKQLTTAAEEGFPITLTVRAESSKPPQSAPSTQDIIDAYLIHMEDGGAAEGYLSVRARKLRFFARQQPRLPIDSEVIHAYLRQFKTADVPTRRDQWTALSALYKFASHTYGVVNLMLDVDKPRFRKKSGQRLSRDQAKLLLTAIRTDLEWALVTCYFGLRFRRVEAERLLFGDIKSDYLIVQGKERTEELPLLPVFREKLLRLESNHRPNQPLFSIKADTLAYHIERIFKRAGIEGVRGSPHTLRNTAGALFSTFGGDWTANRQLLRHSEKTMTDHYSPLTIDELRVKDECHNPMLNLMRELGLAPDYQNTSNVLVTETAPTQQLPELLERMITLGQMAQDLKHALGGNGHRKEQLEEIKELLEHQPSE